MPKQIRRDPVEQLEGAGGGGGSLMYGSKMTGSRAARDTKEPLERPISELGGNLRFRSPRWEDKYSTDRTPRTSDDYKKGGKVSSASRRADGIAQRGKTRGKYL